MRDLLFVLCALIGRHDVDLPEGLIGLFLLLLPGPDQHAVVGVQLNTQAIHIYWDFIE